MQVEKQRTQRYAMNKVIYALLRGWSWVLIGPRLSLLLFVSRSLSLSSRFSCTLWYLALVSSPPRFPQSILSIPHLLWSVLLSLSKGIGIPSFRPTTKEGYFFPGRRFSKEVRGHCSEENTHHGKLKTIIHLLMHEYKGVRDCPWFRTMREKERSLLTYIHIS